MNILFLTPRFPYPPHKGDALRVYHQLRVLGREHRITLLSMSDQKVSPEHLAQVKKHCAHVEVVTLPLAQALLNLGTGLFSDEPLQVRYYGSGAFRRRLDALRARERFDAIHVTLLRMLPYVQHVQDTPVVVDLIDSLTLNLESRRDQVRGVKRWAYEFEYQRVRTYERERVSRLPNLVVSSPADGRLFGEHVAVIPNGVDVDRFPFCAQRGRAPETLVFTGNMGYQPNEEAVLWFAQAVWPLLRAVRPALRFQVVGTGPGERVRALARTCPGIEVTGAVPEVLPYLQKATVAVTPMRSGSGIQNKVLEAMAAGAPVVSSSIGNRGVNGVHDRDLLVADTPEQTAQAVLSLLESEALRTKLATAGRAFVEEHFRWESHARRLAEVYTRPTPRPSP